MRFQLALLSQKQFNNTDFTELARETSDGIDWDAQQSSEANS